ncbi:Cytochrome P450 [Apiospora phragmitis]|uniref:Cytochrome P450 n=1 Tax=Apiospora phragmitis TaxID=2905665 RepID=A0ABR1W6U6_9PEZI
MNGNSKSAIEVMYTNLPNDKPGFSNPLGESLGVLAQKMHIHQLHPNGNNLIHLQRKVQVWIDSHLNMDHLRRVSACTVSQSATHIEVLLYQWVYFGKTLGRVAPGATRAFLVFDELIWKVLYHYPSFLSRDMAAGRAEVVDGLCKYLRTPKEERSDATWLISAMEDEMRALGVGVEDMAIIIFHLYISINTNARKTVFWPPTEKETDKAFDGESLVDPFYIQDPQNCPIVDAVWHETLRIAGWSASIRLITKDTVVGGKLMPKGHRVMVPHRLQHFDEAVFGEETHAFRSDRWLKTDGLGGKDLTKSPSWHPFGAGKTLCSGRFLARFSVTTFVATLLRRFDIEAVGNPSFPEGDEGRPVLGIISIKEGQDFNVRLTARARP